MKATTKQVLTGAAWLAVLLAMIGGVILWQHQVRTVSYTHLTLPTILRV